MKRMTWLCAVALSGVLTLTGCSKPGVTTSKVERSFATAEPATRSDIDNAIAAVNAGKYSEALAYLNKVANKAKLTPDQQQALQDLITQVQKQIETQAGRIATDAGKAAQDAQKSLPFGK